MAEMFLYQLPENKFEEAKNSARERERQRQCAIRTRELLRDKALNLAPLDILTTSFTQCPSSNIQILVLLFSESGNIRMQVDGCGFYAGMSHQLL